MQLLQSAGAAQLHECPKHACDLDVCTMKAGCTAHLDDEGALADGVAVWAVEDHNHLLNRVPQQQGLQHVESWQLQAVECNAIGRSPRQHHACHSVHANCTSLLQQ